MAERIPFLDLVAQDAALRPAILERLANVAASGRFALGPYVEDFERSFAEYCGTRQCVGLNSGTSALHLALRVLGVGPGDEVVTVAATFVATAWAITYCGATPVFVDVEPRTRTMDPELLEAAITPRTKAIVPVHLYGCPADMHAILEIAARHGVPVVEDAAQSHGARIGGDRAGSLGRIGCFSFYPGKNLGAYGEAGALVTDDAELADHARALRDHGQRRRYHHDEVGFNYRMDNFQGAVLGVKLDSLDEWNERRRAVAAEYLAALEGEEAFGLPSRAMGVESAWHLFVVEHAERDRLAADLADEAIETGVHYPVPVHLQPPYRHLSAQLPNTERLCERCLSLPIHPLLTNEQVARVCQRLIALAS